MKNPLWEESEKAHSEPCEADTTKPIKKKPRTRYTTAATLPPKKGDGGVTTSAPKLNRKKEAPRRAGPDSVLIKPTEGSRYRKMLKDFKQKVKTDTLGIMIKSVREIRNRVPRRSRTCSGWQIKAVR